MKDLFFADLMFYYGINSYLAEIGNLLSSKDNLGNAYYGIKKLEEICPINAKVFYYWGLYFAFSEDIEKALEFYQKAHELEPDFTGYLFQIGFIHQAENRLEMAIESYEKVLKLDKNDVQCMNNLAVIYEQLKDYQKAYEMLQKCLKIDKNMELAQKNYIRVKSLI